jgi:hypothetical protein
MRASFTTESTHFQATFSGDAFFGEGNNIHPCYRNLVYNKVNLAKSEQNWKICDVKHVRHNLVQNTTLQRSALQSCSWIGMTSNCIGCGGEVKFQDYNEWTFGYLLNVTETSWVESKNIATYAMPMFPDNH